MRSGTVFLLVLLAAAACSGPQPDEAPVRVATTDASLLEPLHLKEMPKDARSVADVIANAKDGDDVIATGQVPPYSTRPFLAHRAAFILMAKEDLERPEIKEELECDDAAT